MDKNALIAILFLTLPAIAYADAEESSPPPSFSTGERDRIPGEPMKTRDGKTVKVWSTKGPVPVSRAPEPFRDENASNVDNVNVIVGDRDLYRRNRHGGERPDSGTHHPPPPPRESFEVPADR